MSTIPASFFSSVSPSVISAGGAALDITGLLLTANTRVPIGTVASFPNEPSVASYFGAGSTEDLLSTIYFGGFTGSTAAPGAILFAQYNAAAVAAKAKSFIAGTY